MSEVGLSEEQKRRIEENRSKALAIRKSRANHPYNNAVAVKKNNLIQVGAAKYKDSGAGFLLPEIPENTKSDAVDDDFLFEIDNEELPLEHKQCMECKDTFFESYLWKTFDFPVCDACHDSEDKHALITRTEAKNEYLLKDCDLDKREPILKYISKKNPHNHRWGEMKLYLQYQIEKRALEVWETEEALLEAKEGRVEKREKAKVKKYSKQMKQLRMQVRSSLYDRTTEASHVHSFGPDSYNEEDDTYTHECDCGYIETFEKL